MSVTRNTTITQAAMDALADLANTNLLPLVQTLDPSAPEYEFPKVSTLGSSSNASGTAQAGTGYADGSGWLTIRIYAFKTVSSRKEYSPRYTEVGCNLDGSIGGAVDVLWAWDAVPDADGYVLAIITQDGADVSEVGYWQEVATNSLLDDFTGWQLPVSWDDTATFPYNPVTNGSWWLVLQRMRRDIETVVDNALAGPKDLTWLVSGPHCVSVGAFLRYGIGPAYTDVEFYFAADDHGGDIDIETIVEIGTEPNPIVQANTIGGLTPNYRSFMGYNLPNPAPIRGSFVVRQTGSSTGWINLLLAVESGAITINSSGWTDHGSYVQLEFTADLPAGDSCLKVEATSPGGSVIALSAGSSWAEILLATDTYTPVDAVVIHPTSAGKKVTVADIDTALGPIYSAPSIPGTLTWVEYYPLYRTENELEGVWAAMCLPPLGQFTYLENDLPQFTQYDGAFGLTSRSLSSARNTSPGIVDSPTGNVTPAVRARESRWPVFNDADLGMMRQVTIDNDTTKLQYPVPWFPTPFQYFTEEDVTLAVGATIQRTFTPEATYERLKLEALDAPLATIYVSQSQPPNPNDGSTYDLAVNGIADLPSDFAVTPGVVFYYAVKNNTAAALELRLRTSQFVDLGITPPAQEPQFFLLGPDGERCYEGYSYCTSLSTRNGSQGSKLSIPLSGYCIFELRVARKPVNGVIPSTGEPALGFDIGLRHGVTADTDGAYVSLVSGSIGANLAAETIPVFIPVLAGAALMYQALEEVEVFASTNFQPQVISKLHPSRTQQTPVDGIYISGTFSGEPYLTESLLRYRNFDNNQDPVITLPVCAMAYNDLENTLNLL